MLLILGAAHRASEGERMMRARAWPGWEPTQLLGTRLDGKRLGILGMGQIGRAVAQRARAFDMEIHYHNRSPLPADQEQGAVYHDSAEALFAVSDILSLHAPSTPKTRGIVNARTIAALPERAILVNTARGGLVNERDLVTAIKEGLIAGAAFDVVTSEPPAADNPLLELLDRPNFILTPHVAWASLNAQQCLADQTIDNIENFAKGQPSNRVA